MNTTDKKMSRGNFLKLGVGSIIGAALMPSVLANTFLRKTNSTTIDIDDVYTRTSNDSRYLKLDCSNANINIDIGSYDLTTTGTLSGGTLTDGTATLSGGIVTGLTTPLTFGQGGTGLATWTQYLIPYADTTTSMGQIAIGDATQVLTSNGAGAAPTFQAAAGGSVSFWCR